MGTTGAASLQQPAQGAVWAITNARIHPVTKPVIERGTIVIRGSKIEAVGAGVSVRWGEDDRRGGRGRLSGLHQRAHDTRPRRARSARVRRRERDARLQSELRAVVAYQADSDAIPVARANGVTTVAWFPPADSGGQVAVMNSDGMDVEAAIRQTAGVSFTFPPSAARDSSARRRRRRSRSGPTTISRRSAIRSSSGRAAGGRCARVCEGAEGSATHQLVARSARADRREEGAASSPRTVKDIRDAVAFADRVKVNMILTGAMEAPLVAPLLKEKNIPVILGSVLTLPARGHVPRGQLSGGRRARPGWNQVRVRDGDNTNVRLVPVQRGDLRRGGCRTRKAIKALTINAADILGVADRMGSIEPGKDANLLVSKGDPLEIRTTISHVVIAGKNVDLDNNIRRSSSASWPGLINVSESARRRAAGRPADPHGMLSSFVVACSWHRAAWSRRRTPTRPSHTPSAAHADRDGRRRADRLRHDRPARRSRRIDRSGRPCRGTPASSTAPASPYPGLIDMGTAAGIELPRAEAGVQDDRRGRAHKRDRSSVRSSRRPSTFVPTRPA